MEECRTPTGQHISSYNRTPILSVINKNSHNIRCSTPIFDDLRSPNMSPIKDMRAPRRTTSATFYKKAFKKQQQMSKSSLKPPGRKVEDRNNSLDEFMDDSSSGNSAENSLCKESRRRSLLAANHSYVINHASNVHDVLLLVGLESYLDKFEKAHIDLVELVSMEYKDLKRLGLRNDEDCNRILDALKEI
ncbi:protein matrimony-like [Drosophila montana]|uniref:protein matrimony-like n=1 Tax=Drosophila montana TaxID=40370 RepID=UPI00313CB272